MEMKQWPLDSMLLHRKDVLGQKQMASLLRLQRFCVCMQLVLLHAFTVPARGDGNVQRGGSVSSMVASANADDAGNGAGNGAAVSTLHDLDAGETGAAHLELRREAHKYSMLSRKLDFVQMDGAGLGVQASEAVDEGEVLVHIPSDLCVTAALATRSLGVAGVLEALDPPAEPHTAIAVWLMRARHHPPEHPLLRSWLRALPAQFDCTLEWTDEQLEQLQLSPARARAHTMREWAHAEWERLFGTSQASAARPLVDFPHEEGDFRYALCAVWSRSFQMSCSAPYCAEGTPWRVLVPVADMLNHVTKHATVASGEASVETAGGAAAPTAGRAAAGGVGDVSSDASAAARLEVRAANGLPEAWHHDERPTAARRSALQTATVEASGATRSVPSEKNESQTPSRPSGGTGDSAQADAQPVREDVEAFLLRAARPIAAGEEVTLDYGPRANAELVTTHGFAIAANAHESVLLSLGPQPSDALSPVKEKLLRAGNLSAPYTLSLAALRTDSDLLLVLRLLSANAAELQRYADAFEGRALSPANERRWARMLGASVRAMLEKRETVTSERADAAAVAAGPTHTRGVREWVALLTRHAEKRMLVDVLAEIDARKKSLSSHTAE